MQKKVAFADNRARKKHINAHGVQVVPASFELERSCRDECLRVGSEGDGSSPFNKRCTNTYTHKKDARKLIFFNKIAVDLFAKSGYNPFIR